MKKVLLVIPIFLTLLFLIATPALATVSQSAPSPADDATGLVPRDTTSFTITLASDASPFLMNGTITCVNTGQVATLSSVANGTATITFSPALSEQTKYRINANVSDITGGNVTWTNTSYNFTTGRQQLLSDSPNSAILKVITGLTTVLVALGLVYFTAVRFMNGDKGIKEMMEMVKILVFGLVFLGIVAAIIFTF